MIILNIMKKFSALLLLIVLIVIFLNRCVTSGCTKISLSKSEKEWIQVYDSNQVVVFRSNLKHLDTFIVSYVYDLYTPCNRIELSQYEYNYSIVKLKSKRCHGSYHCEVSLEFSKKLQESEQIQCNKYFRVFDLWSDDFDLLDSLKKQNISLNSSNEKIDTYYFDQENNAKDIDAGICFIKSFNWNKKRGLVRYETKDGEIFELIKK